MRSAWWDINMYRARLNKRERVLGRVGRAVNAAARDFAREAAQLENGGGREAAAERLVVSWSSSFAQCPASTQSHTARWCPVRACLCVHLPT